jgi:hypothetical protein
MTLNEVRALASNIVKSDKNVEYNINTFLQYLPQFSKIENEQVVSIAPAEVVDNYIEMGKDAIQKGRWGAKYKMALSLYVAHYLTLYLQSYQEASEDNDKSSAAGSGTALGNVSSASQGDQSISYDNNSLVAGTQQWGSWNATTYGQQLITEAKILGMGGAVIG